MQAQRAYRNYSNTALQITCSTVFVQEVVPEESYSYITVVRKGQGYLFQKGYIGMSYVTAFAPPSISSGAIPQYLFNVVPFDGRIKNLPLPASAITAVINGMAEDYVAMEKQLTLLGGSGSDGIAVAQILGEGTGWNYGTGSILGIKEVSDGCGFKFACRKGCSGNPNEKPYPYHEYVHVELNQCKAKALLPGSCKEVGIPTCLLTRDTGRLRFNGGPGVCLKGQVMNSIFTDGSGRFLPESLLVSADIPKTVYGQPVIDSDGNVLGMISRPYLGGSAWDSESESGSIFIGPNCCTIQRVISAIALSQNCTGRENREDVIEYNLGGYSVVLFNQPYLGISYEVVEGEYEMSTNYTSGQSQYPTLVTSVPNGSFLGTGPVVKNVSGIRVTGIAGINPDNLTNVAYGAGYVPGGPSNSPLVAGIEGQVSLPDDSVVSAASPLAVGESPLLNSGILPGAIITHICISGEGAESPGQRSCASNLSSFLKQSTRVGNSVTITYVASPADGTTPNDETINVNARLTNTPAIAAYPWSEVHAWSDVIKYLNMSYFPSGQLFPGNTTLNGDGPFFPQRVDPALNGYFLPSL